MGMSRAKREAAKVSHETRKGARATIREDEHRKALQKEEAVREALTRAAGQTSQKLIDDIVEQGCNHGFFAQARGSVYTPTLQTPAPDKLRPFLKAVATKAPKLFTQDYGIPFYYILNSPWIRRVEEWEPKGKGRDTQFRSLCDHLFSKFQTPPFLWSGFSSFSGGVFFAPVIASVAGGGSFYEHVKNGKLPVPLTRKMCHDLLRSTADVTLIEAIRKVQVAAVGGDRRLLRAWLASGFDQLQITPIESFEANEKFWATVLHWFAQNPMLDVGQLGPLCDYIRYRKREDANFSMKGRGALALMRGMEEWHGNLQKTKVAGKKAFAPSGFKEGFFDFSTEQNGYVVPDIWRVTEILTARDLADEGRLLKHCVFSYQWAIERGTTSIWGLTHENESGHWRQCTVEVRNDMRKVVQVRGALNRSPTAKELNVLNAWAEQTGLQVTVGRW